MKVTQLLVLASLVGTGCAVSNASPDLDTRGSTESTASLSTIPPGTAPGCGTAAGCVVATQGGIGSTSCKPFATWRGYAADDCKSRGLTLTEVAVGSACGDGNSFEYTRYTCCPAAAAPKCPAKASDWPPGSSCVGPLEGCTYPNACGGTDEWHCKEGTWQMNACTNCCAP